MSEPQHHAPPPPEGGMDMLPVPQAPEWPPYCDPTYMMPGMIQVTVANAQGETIRIPVAIEKASASKRYDGGECAAHNL